MDAVLYLSDWISEHKISAKNNIALQEILKNYLPPKTGEQTL